jgi:hypothetical protein
VVGGHISVAAMMGADHRAFLLSGFSVKDWSTLLMLASIPMTDKVEPKDLKSVDDEPNWFPFEWFLDPDNKRTD